VYAPWSQFRSENTGGALEFSFRLPFDVFHSFQYELAMKEVHLTSKRAPFFVREQCGPRLAAIFRYVGAWDRRDDSVFPTRGFFVRTTNEIIGSKFKKFGNCDLVR
jgi:outer membrane protein insertion porin family